MVSSHSASVLLSHAAAAIEDRFHDMSALLYSLIVFLFGCVSFVFLFCLLFGPGLSGLLPATLSLLCRCLVKAVIYSGTGAIDSVQRALLCILLQNKLIACT